MTSVSNVYRFSVDNLGIFTGLTGINVFKNGLLAERPGQLLPVEMVRLRFKSPNNPQGFMLMRWSYL
jgi:hypothetical protein